MAYIFLKDQAATFLGLSELGLRDQTCSLTQFSHDPGTEVEYVSQGLTEAFVLEPSVMTQKCESTLRHILVPRLKN